MTFSNQRGESMRGYSVPMPSLSSPNATGGRGGSANQRGESMRGFGLSMPRFRLPSPGTVSGGSRGAQPGSAPVSRAASLPAGYAHQERLMAQQASNSRITGAARAAAPALPPMHPAATVPTYSRPAPAASLDQDYRVPAGAAPLPVAAPAAPQNSTASRANAVLAPIGASRNEGLVQAAGNAGLRLIDPGAAAMFQGSSVLPSLGKGTARRMLSEFGASNPALSAASAIDASGVNAAAALSPETLQAAAAGFQQPPAGDRFAHLRPDIAAWARHHQNAPKGLDGKNIVDRFMEKQTAPITLSGPSTIGFADGRQVTGPLPEGAPMSFPASTVGNPARSFIDLDRSPGMQNQTMDLFGAGPLSTTGTGIGLSAEQQSQLISTPPPSAQTQMVQTAFNPATDLVDQVQMLREMYRNNSRPAPGTAGPRP